MTRVGSDYNLILSRRFLDRTNAAYTKSLEPLATGRRINRPSDDPARMAEYFDNVNRLTQLEQYSLNIANARTRTGIADSSLAEMNELMNEVYEIAVAGNDQSLTTEERAIYTERLAAIKEDLVGLANTRLGNVYVFAGYQTATEPFSGTPTTYNGDSKEIFARVAENREVKINIDADETFMGGGTGVDIFDTIDELVTAIEDQDEVAMGTLITDVQTGLEQINAARMDIGNAIKGLDAAETNLENRKQQITERIGALVDVDMAEATTTMSFNEYTLKSSLEVTKRVLAISLQNFFD